ncbi:flagellin [Lacrimispora xylanisolvens]|uniref:flagellin N-terminal helical domain-containing protein n=1 Tax=Lacrimispora xylanisolvens TaxID=384636 RepID=UPI002402AFC3|nr:flagellin [Paenibacillaceae bacterium]
MRIQHNIAALNSYRQLGSNNSSVSKNLEKLSSGYRINRAGDDAAGLAISEKMRAQITGLETASKNANDGISLVQTAEGALTEVHSMLNRMVELATQSANGTYQDNVDRENLTKEVDSLKSEIDRISEGTNFNGINLLDGSLGKTTGAPKVMVGIGSTVGSAKVTGASGASIAVSESATTGEEVGIKVDGTTSKITVTITNNVDGSSKTTVIDLADVTTRTNGTDTDGKSLVGQKLGATGTLKTGETATIDLSSVGLGRIEIAGTIDAGDTAITLAQGLKDIGGVGTSSGTSAVGSGLALQIGDSGEDFNTLTVSVGSMSSKALGLNSVDVSTQSGAKAAIKTIKDAINTVSSTRGDLGALQNRLEHTINNLGVTSENMTAAESRIRDVDMAKEMMNYTKNNILVQSSQAMLAQANQLPQGVLQLLK